jgi:hypothetical protein
MPPIPDIKFELSEEPETSTRDGYFYFRIRWNRQSRKGKKITDTNKRTEKFKTKEERDLGI